MNLEHHFLIAMPSLSDREFTGSVTYLVQHNQEGAFGFIINKALDLTLNNLFSSLDIAHQIDETTQYCAYHGGPIHFNQVFILQPRDEATPPLSLCNQKMHVITDECDLKKTATTLTHRNFLLCLGYCGWSPGQLENELKQNLWLAVPANEAILFHPNPETKYPLALSELGVDIAHLSQCGGIS